MTTASEGKEIEKFDPSKLMDGVRDRIKATFVALIPDEQWEVMCKAEMDKFFFPVPEKDYNGRITGHKPSQFEQIVIDLMKEHCKKHLVELFAKPEYSVQSVWEHNTNTNRTENNIKLSDHLDKMIKERMPDMMMTMFKAVMADAFNNFFYQAQQRASIAQH